MGMVVHVYANSRPPHAQSHHRHYSNMQYAIQILLSWDDGWNVDHTTGHQWQDVQNKPDLTNLVNVLKNELRMLRLRIIYVRGKRVLFLVICHLQLGSFFVLFFRCVFDR